MRMYYSRAMVNVIKPSAHPAYARMSGKVYDLIYAGKDYELEAVKIAAIIEQRSKSGGNRVLEAACGTGSHMAYLRQKFSIDGFDLSEGQVEEAKEKFPDANIVQADMLDFDMGQQYDAVLCLFSSIGHLKTKKNLKKAIANMVQHTKPGGVVIIEPWYKTKDFFNGTMSFEAAAARDGLSVACMCLISSAGNLTTLSFHHMVGTSERIDHFVEDHVFARYSDDDFFAAFAAAGLSVEADPIGIAGRGLYIATKPL